MTKHRWFQCTLNALVAACLLGECGANLNAMPGVMHAQLASLVREVPIEKGGLGGMPEDQLKAINDWMDYPATQTGQYINSHTDAPIHPRNHGHLRHNPADVARVFSGDGSVHPGAVNAARIHKIADVAHNTAGVDGYEISASMRAEAQAIVDALRARNGLPKSLPAWVDASGPIRQSTTELAPAGAELATAAGKVITRSLGPVAAVGGAVQIADGMATMQAGQVVEGSAEIGAGAANVSAGIALTVGRVAAGATLGGAAAVLDGGKDLYLGVKSGNAEQTGVGAVKSAAGAAMIAGASTLQPHVAAAGAAVYGGAVFYDHRESIVQAARIGTEVAAQGVTQSLDAAESWASRALPYEAQRMAADFTPAFAERAYIKFRSWFR